MNYNKVMVAGNLTRDVELKFLQSGKAVGSFGLAINQKYKGADGEQKENTTFLDIEVWGKTAELCGQYLTKGRGCFLEGRLKLETWDDKATGQKRSKIKVVADVVQFIGGPKGSHEGVGESAAPVATSFAPGVAPADDSPPFAADRNDSSWA